MPAGLLGWPASQSCLLNGYPCRLVGPSRAQELVFMSGEFTPCLLRASPAPKGIEKEWLRLYTKASFGISSSVPMARPDRLWGQAAGRGTQSTFYLAGLDLKKTIPQQLGNAHRNLATCRWHRHHRLSCTPSHRGRMRALQDLFRCGGLERFGPTRRLWVQQGIVNDVA